ncbi:MAG: hypothetical protein Fur0018_17360 [Anaerolineales bacterium]
MRAAWRDTRLLLREFRFPLLAFSLMLLGGGGIYDYLSQLAGEPLPSFAESVYHILGLVFLQPVEPFPKAWYLQLFFFLMPMLGLGVLAQGITDFAIMLFNRRLRGKAWEVAMASTMQSHIVLVGLGHLGFRVLRELRQLEKHLDLVVIERQPDADLAARVRKMGIPIIEADATLQTALQEAGIGQARAIVICIQDDSIGLQIAVKARSINPDIHVVVRIFDDEFAADLSAQFGFQAMSATGMAAPIFASATTGIEMTRPISVEGQALSLARLVVDAHSPVCHQCIADLEANYHVSVVMLRRGDGTILHPGANQRTAPNDTLVILGGPAEISFFAQNNECRQ